MERFDTMLEAAEYAATLCGNFRFATSDDRYYAKDLLVLAETSDSENPFVFLSCSYHSPATSQYIAVATLLAI